MFCLCTAQMKLELGGGQGMPNLSQISFLNNFLQEDTEAPSQPSSSLHKVLEALPIPFAQQSGLAEF